MSAERPLSYGQLGALSRVHVSRDGINVTDSAGEVRVRLGRIVEFQEGGSDNDYGVVVRNPAGIVVIDGASNMFKIAATGTIGITGCDAPAETACEVTTTVDLSTGLTTPPAHLGFLEFASGEASSLPYSDPDSTGVDIGRFANWLRLDTQVVNTDQTRVTARWTVLGVGGANNRSGTTLDLRYYVLKEAAI